MNQTWSPSVVAHAGDEGVRVLRLKMPGHETQHVTEHVTEHVTAPDERDQSALVAALQVSNANTLKAEG
eukprot:2372711-Rhodomonas_salina.2